MLLFHETVVRLENDTESWWMTLTDAEQDDLSMKCHTIMCVCVPNADTHTVECSNRQCARLEQ